MSLHIRQRVARKATDERTFEPPDGMTDIEYLHVKAVSHADKGWEVKWLAEEKFRATMKRWEKGVTCTRTFWID